MFEILDVQLWIYSHLLLYFSLFRIVLNFKVVLVAEDVRCIDVEILDLIQFKILSWFK